MTLQIHTFSSASGGGALFKAFGHPDAVERAHGLIARLERAGGVAVYDPLGQLATFASLYDLSGVQVAGVFVQDVERVGEPLLGQAAQPVTELKGAPVGTVFLAAFDARRLADQIRPLLPAGTHILTLDEMRLPEGLLTDRRTYLSPLNFATNFAFFREQDGHHTRLVTANYWAAYGGRDVRLWATLFDEGGRRIVTWEDRLAGPNSTIIIDSADLRARFDLGEFTGQLFVHIIGAAGHEVVKYALDTYGDDERVLSCTHDANAWPSNLYGGLPAPRDDETVVLWVQNSHPTPIPAGGIGLNLMGDDAGVAWLGREIPGFATYRLDVAELLPAARWPQQIEARAGKHFVRPRYEIWNANGRQRIAHMNVERTDLKPDPRLPEMGNLMGKGFILPAPILPVDRYRTLVQPTPMATTQQSLPIAAILFDANGKEVGRRPLGNLPRAHETAFDLTAPLANGGPRLPSGHGHVELVYDFAAGSDADGWLHAIFRYEDLETGHTAETSFGSHIFNTVLTYKSEPQSYAGRPPGLTTRLFLRLGPDGTDAMCCLIYPASTPWHAHSATSLILVNQSGEEIATKLVQIPCSGSHLFRVGETFSAEDRKEAGPDGYVLIRDLTCRLFGYHGLVRTGGAAFSLDHMFGF
ncbi:MAG: hypothetical protein H6842_01275 [Rhodospirillaceae bacterium]|nr:hypothetical protein [Rhodospirillaceae bacterium]